MRTSRLTIPIYFFCFVGVCQVIFYFYLSVLGQSAPLSDVVVILGPAPLLYFLLPEIYPIYAISAAVVLAVSLLLWWLSFALSKAKRIVAVISFSVFWVLSGFYSLGVTFYAA